MNKFFILIVTGIVFSIISPVCLADANITEIITYPEFKTFDKSKYDELYSKFSYQEIVSISVNNFDVENQKAELTLKLRTCVKGEGCFIMPLVFPCIMK